MSRMKELKQVQNEEVDGYECCMQWSLLVFNILLFFVAIACISLGSWTLSQRSYIIDLQGDNGNLLQGFCIVLILVGVFLFCVAFVGCFAAFVENRILLLIYYILILIIFVAMTVTVVLGYAYRSKITSSLRRELVASVALYDPEKPDDPITMAWDQLQRDQTCCGVMPDNVDYPKAWLVWQTNKQLNSGIADSRVPTSCCIRSGSSGDTTDCNPNNNADDSLIYTDDCFDNAHSVFNDHVETVAIVAIFFVFMLILAAVFSICLYYLVD